MFFDFFRYTVWILRWKTSVPKVRLLLTYFRITFKYFLLVHLLKRPVTKERIFDRPISFFDYELFKLMFEEVFIAEEYRFHPTTESPRILDCGGNIGLPVLYFKMLYPAARITSFEASPNTFELLERNVRNNGFKDVELLNRVVWDREGEVPLYFNPQRPGDMGASTEREGIRPGTIAVRGIPLSSYLDEPVDFVKMDIEGSEDTVIQEVARSGKMRMINEFRMEYHHHIRPDCDRLAGLLGAFETNGLGYQLSTFCRLEKNSYQQILLYAYRK